MAEKKRRAKPLSDVWTRADCRVDLGVMFVFSSSSSRRALWD